VFQLLRQKLGRSLVAGCLLAGASAPALGANHAIYIGVAKYQFGLPDYPRGTVRNLTGAPQDIDLIRRALESRFDFERPDVLMNETATRSAILAKLAEFASGAKGKSGDTLVVYYTGHGARFYDTSGTQAGRFNSTLVPYDARDPVKAIEGEHGDILDIELKPIIGAISARGINVVTIFDSCNSGTATRAGIRRVRSKAAPSVKGSGVPNVPMIAAAEAASRPGYVVHLAGASDGTEAFEADVEKGSRSDFTFALAKAIQKAPPGATYKEVFHTAQLELVQAGLGQDPRAEGALLTPLMGEAQASARVLEAKPSGEGEYVLEGGTLAGIDRGASVSLYATIRDALGGRAVPLAKARVASADPWTAKVKAAIARPLVFARQDMPSFEAQRLRVALVAQDQQRAQAAQAELNAYDFLELSSSEPAYVLEVGSDTTRILSSAGAIVRVVRSSDRTALAKSLEALARYHGLLAIARNGPEVAVELGFAATDCNGENAVPLAQQSGQALLKSGNRFHLTMRNNDQKPLYFYLLALSADYSVELLDPPSHAAAVPIVPGRCYEPLSGTAADKGTHHLLLIAAERPLPTLHMLQQDAIRGTPPEDPLERLLFGAASGLRAPPQTAPLPRWGARILTYKVE
jgi:hypothetical protein